MAEKKYVVAPGHAITARGTVFGPGDEVSEKVFVDKSSFLGHINNKIIIQAPAKEDVVDPEAAALALKITEAKAVVKAAKETLKAAETAAKNAAPDAKADADAKAQEAKDSLAAAEAELERLTA